MNHYAAEQLASQRRAELVRDAHGGHVVRLAQSAATQPTQPTVSQPPRRIEGLMRRLRAALPTAAS